MIKMTGGGGDEETLDTQGYPQRMRHYRQPKPKPKPYPKPKPKLEPKPKGTIKIRLIHPGLALRK